MRLSPEIFFSAMLKAPLLTKTAQSAADDTRRRVFFLAKHSDMYRTPEGETRLKLYYNDQFKRAAQAARREAHASVLGPSQDAYAGYAILKTVAGQTRTYIAEREKTYCENRAMDQSTLFVMGTDIQRSDDGTCTINLIKRISVSDLPK